MGREFEWRLNQKGKYYENDRITCIRQFLALSGVNLAQQSEDQSETASMKESISQMMKEKQSDKDGMRGMGDMSGMME
jgi:hypothetical protein